MRIECDRCVCPPTAAENRRPVCGQIADHGPWCRVSPATASSTRITDETISTPSCPRYPDPERANPPDPLVPGRHGLYHLSFWRQPLCDAGVFQRRCCREHPPDALVPGYSAVCRDLQASTTQSRDTRDTPAQPIFAGDGAVAASRWQRPGRTRSAHGQLNPATAG